MADERRVVVTGLGAVCPLGTSVDKLWENLVEGRTAVRDVTDTYPFLEDHHAKIGSLFRKEQLKSIEDDLLIKNGIRGKDVRNRMAWFSKFAVEASRQALVDSGLLDILDDELCDKTGACIGTGIGGLLEIEKSYERYTKLGISGYQVEGG